MDYLDDDEFPQRPAPSRPSPVIIVALLAGAGAAVLLLWMNLGLTSRVSSLEESIAALQKTVSEQNQTKEVADLANQMDSVTQALSRHLKSQAMNRTESRGSLATSPSSVPSFGAIPSRSLPSRDLPVQPIPGERAPASGNYRSYNSGALPPPVSRVDINPVQRNASPVQRNANPAQSNYSGGWVVNITSVSDAESAYQEVERLRSMGINAESARAFSNGRVWFRIRVPGFATHDEASNARPALEARLGIRDTWVGKRD